MSKVSTSFFRMADEGMAIKSNLLGQGNKIKQLYVKGTGSKFDSSNWQTYGDSNGKVSKTEIANNKTRINELLISENWTEKGRKQANEAIDYFTNLEQNFAKFDENNDGELDEQESYGPQDKPALGSVTQLKHFDLFDAMKGAAAGITVLYKNAIGGKKVKEVHVENTDKNYGFTKDQAQQKLNELNQKVAGRKFTNEGRKTYDKIATDMATLVAQFDSIDTNKNGKIDKDER
ncbi:MAG: hypothetical protein QE263_08090 [Vampirovibrionales bacterium]|nr:hypothetical protein [Vampirovibrionales bacterium]